MYESKPKDRVGEPVEYVIPEAINVTASKERRSSGGFQLSVPWPKWLPEGKGAFAGAAVVAIVEAFVLLWVLFT